MSPQNQPSIGMLITDLGRQLRRQFDRRAKDLGYTRVQWQALTHLSKNEGIHQTGLAELLEVEPITLCRLVDRMEEGGLVERRPDPEDRRARRLYMTDRAREASGELRIHGAEMMDAVTAGFSGEELEQLRELLMRLRTNILALSEET